MTELPKRRGFCGTEEEKPGIATGRRCSFISALAQIKAIESLI